MGKHYTFEFEQTGRASQEGAYELLRNAEKWSSWAGPAVRTSRWEGGPLIDNVVVGRVRLVGTPPVEAAEQVTIDEAPTTHGYRIMANWPVRNYSAKVVLTPGADGALTVNWSGEFEENIPGSGVLWRAFLKRFLGHLAKNLLKAAAN